MIVASETQFHNPPEFKINLDLLREFERGLDPRSPGNSRIPARVLGYGEISTVLEIEAEDCRGLAFKRLSIFESPAEIKRYLATYVEYIRLLEEEIGVRLPPHGYAAFPNPGGRPVFYIVQKKLPAAAIGNKALGALPPESAPLFVRRVLRELRKVWDYNGRQNHLRVAIDGQLSNWAIEGFDAGHSGLDEPVSLLYVDTSTPIYRIEGQEQLDPELFLRNAPSFMVWLIRLLFLKDVLDRYYDFRKVIVDLIANLYKEQRPELIPSVVREANAFLASEGSNPEAKPITEKEVRAYYQEDAFIWSFYLSARKLDRLIQTQILRREYPYILPGKTKR